MNSSTLALALNHIESDMANKKVNMWIINRCRLGCCRAELRINLWRCSQLEIMMDHRIHTSCLILISQPLKHPDAQQSTGKKIVTFPTIDLCGPDFHWISTTALTQHSSSHRAMPQLPAIRYSIDYYRYIQYITNNNAIKLTRRGSITRIKKA